MDRETMSDQQDDNPFAYYETQREELPGELSLQNQLRLVAIKDITRGLALAMIFPSLLMSGMLMMSLLHAVSDGDPGGEETLLEFLQYVAFVIFPVGGIPWLITIFVTVGLFRGNLLAVNVGMVFSFLPTLVSLGIGLLVMRFPAFIPFFFCGVYSFEFVRVRIAISKVGYIHEREEPDL